MKKLVLLLGILFFYGCSNENLEKTAETNARPWHSETTPNQKAAKPSCLGGDILVTMTESLISTHGATVNWDTSDIASCDLLSANIQIRPVSDCPNQTGLGAIQNYPIPNFIGFSSGTMEITHEQIGKKCVMWRLVLDGACNPNITCNTSTPWKYCLLVNY